MRGRSSTPRTSTASSGSTSAVARAAPARSCSVRAISPSWSAARCRDFPVTALFYDRVKEEVWDYGHGLKDLKARKLVMIGDPATRYREDPVRMLRAARLAAKLGLEIDPGTREPIRAHRHLLENVPQARLFEEILKLLMSGNAVECVRVLRELELHHGLLPLLDTALEDPDAGPFAMAALRATDERIEQEKPVSPAFLLAALLWGQVE